VLRLATDPFEDANGERGEEVIREPVAHRVDGGFSVRRNLVSQLDAFVRARVSRGGEHDAQVG
jgi:hypothetical protein